MKMQGKLKTFFMVFYLKDNAFLGMVESSYQFQSLHKDSFNNQTNFKIRNNSMITTIRPHVHLKNVVFIKHFFTRFYNIELSY